MITRITASDRKGQNRIDNHGEYWRIVKHEPSVQCFNGRGGMLLQSVITDYLFWLESDRPDPHNSLVIYETQDYRDRMMGYL